MKILKENIDELLVKTKHIVQKQYNDIKLNIFLNYWIFFDEKETMIQELTNEPLEVILYSKYYWCSRYKDRYTELYGHDAGIEQQQYKIIEELEQKVAYDIDWNFIQFLEENNL